MMETKEQLFSKQEIKEHIATLKNGGTVMIDGVELEMMKCGEAAPCWKCQTKFHFSRKICQLCIELDYSFIGSGEKTRYKIKEKLSK